MSETSSARTSVYVHFPWCLQKCPYCDFATRAIERAAIPQTAYTDAVLRELDVRAPALAGRELVSVFVGGGTPSLWEPRELGRVIAGVRAAFDRESSDVEITVECNPSSLDGARAAALRQAGVNRLSVGVQSLDDARLRFLGRLHDAALALEAVAAARAEVPRVSGDLMFGAPGQTAAEARDDAKKLVDAGLTHVSAYALTIEPGTRFGELHRKGQLAVAKDDAYADMYLAVEDELGRAGLLHYEVSNYALPGEESRHNAHYWRAGAYVGLGAAAVGCLDAGVGRARRWRNDPASDAYCERAGRETTEIEEEALDPETLVREALMLGLRTSEGVSLDATRERTGIDLRVGRRAKSLDRRGAAGDVVERAGALVVPQERWLRLDSIVSDLF